MTEAEENRLIIENMGLIPTIAADFRGVGVDFEDLLSAGREGLTKAARSFNPKLSNAFVPYASGRIRTAVSNFVRSEDSETNLEYDFAPSGSDRIERIYEYDHWGERGNASAISERWSRLDSSPEELSILYGEVKDKRAKFEAAFMSLSGNQRKLVTWVFLIDPVKSIAQAARELGVSYLRGVRMLNKALKTMREVISRMETNSGGNVNERLPINRPALTAASPGTRLGAHSSIGSATPSRSRT